MRRPVLALLALLALPASASAATVRVDVTPADGRTPGTSDLVYTAAPGEQNRLVASMSGDTVTVDDVVPITPGANCRRPVAGDPTLAVCTLSETPGASFALGDGND